MAEPEAIEWQHMECRLPPRLTAEQKVALQTKMTLEDRSEYFALSRCPITSEAEQSMESASHVVTKEHYTDHWDRGNYHCARCGHALYDNTTKFVGPCLWPSFREGVADGLKTIVVPTGSYNAYKCEVHELYCGGCSLFLGHKFDDGPASGDTHADARWRHCVLTLSLRFMAYGDVD